MKSFGNEIIIHRGETFTIDKTLENKDRTPYIISSKLQNPYFLITITDSRYSQADRYVANYWLDLSDFPRFYNTNCIDLHQFKTSPSSDEIKYKDFPNTSALEGYVGLFYATIDGSEAVIYVDKNGVREYKYYSKELDQMDYEIGWVEYKCRLIKHFSREDTENLTGQNYLYSIRLVAGPDPLNNSIDLDVPILAPTKLTVISNL